MANITQDDQLAIHEMLVGKKEISIQITCPNGGGTVVEGRITNFVAPYVAVEYENGGEAVVNLAAPAVAFFIVW